MLCFSVTLPRYSTLIRGFNPCTQSLHPTAKSSPLLQHPTAWRDLTWHGGRTNRGEYEYEYVYCSDYGTVLVALQYGTVRPYRAKYTKQVRITVRYSYCRSRGEAMSHIFQKNATKFETRITRHETIRHDSVCDVMRFRKFTDTFD